MQVQIIVSAVEEGLSQNIITIFLSETKNFRPLVVVLAGKKVLLFFPQLEATFEAREKK